MAEEGSIRNQRIEVTRENEPGVFPTDPDLMLFSNNVTSFEWSPTPGVSERRGLGTPDIVDFYNGPEEHEVTVAYDLYRFPVDTNGDPDDPSGDGVVRDANNDLPNTHSFMVREENLGIPASETVDGSTSRDTHLYLVGVGGRISSVTFSGDPGSDQPITCEITYTLEKVREYQIDQPNAETLEIENTGSSEVDVTVEDDGAATSETLTVSKGSTATTADTFDSLDAVSLSSDLDGDVIVSETTSGETLAKIRGGEFYGHGEGDLGVPALGAGSRGTEISGSTETIIGDEIERPDGSPIAYELNSVEFTVENEVSTREQVSTPRMGMSVGNRTATVAATVVGPTESVKNAEQALGNRAANVRWTLTSGWLQADTARLTDFGGVSKTEGEAAMSLDNTFTGESATAKNTS